MTDYLDSKEFYELMQAYRWAGQSSQNPAAVVAAFEAVKAYIRAQSSYAASTLRLTELLRDAAHALEACHSANEDLLSKRRTTAMPQANTGRHAGE